MYLLQKDLQRNTHVSLRIENHMFPTRIMAKMIVELTYSLSNLHKSCG